MRVSKSFIPTLKEIPQEAEIPSHQLMLRAGLMRKVASGIYEYLPLAHRSLIKIMNIIRQEMEMVGAQEVLLPILTPAELWLKTGRWQKYGKELMRVQDRHSRDFALGPTHEEVITDLVQSELKSYKQLPLNLFQIATKFRDEVRPRFGVMRSREFIMKDGYSFDVDEIEAEKTYWKMVEAYKRIFKRCGLFCSPVEADSGLIGGNFSHEFMVMAETGEAAVAFCKSCDYSANLETAKSIPTVSLINEIRPACKVPTPNYKSVSEVSNFLKVSANQIIKTLIYVTEGDPIAVIIRGDHEVNETKLQNYLKVFELKLASHEEVEKITHMPMGFVGPVGLKDIRIIGDLVLKEGHGYIAGGAEPDVHWTYLEIGRDFPTPEWADIRNVVTGEACVGCSQPLNVGRGIEVGQTFKLGKRYSTPMHCVFLSKSGVEEEVTMGCYGIGVSRTLAAAIEQHYDEFGICWPIAIAPYQIHLLLLSPNDAEAVRLAEMIYDQCVEKKIEVLYDDRLEASVGFKFKDADLIGLPISVRIGSKSVKEGIVEIKIRRNPQVMKVPIAQFFENLIDLLQEEWKRCEP